jgi:hypothetical protein
MIRKICGAVLIVVVLLCGLSNPLAAQSCTGKFAIVRFVFLAAVTNQNGCFWLAPSVVPGDYLVTMPSVIEGHPPASRSSPPSRLGCSPD